MKYFAYGSNMSLSRLQKRVPSAKRLGVATLESHQLRFHKISRDGSGKCDAYATNDPADIVIGGLFEIDIKQKQSLDEAEGLGYEYDEKNIQVKMETGELIDAYTYFALRIESSSKPYSWYLNHVIVGAKELALPPPYLEQITAMESIEDTDIARESAERAIYS